jgi:hypothetical protein
LSGCLGMPKLAFRGLRHPATRGAKMNGLRGFRWVALAAVVVALAACSGSASGPKDDPGHPRRTRLCGPAIFLTADGHIIVLQVTPKQ